MFNGSPFPPITRNTQHIIHQRRETALQHLNINSQKFQEEAQKRMVGCQRAARSFWQMCITGWGLSSPPPYLFSHL